jgi:hypothetical protein
MPILSLWNDYDKGRRMIRRAVEFYISQRLSIHYFVSTFGLRPAACGKPDPTEGMAIGRLLPTLSLLHFVRNDNLLFCCTPSSSPRLSDNSCWKYLLWIPACAGMTNRGYQIQIHLNLVAYFTFILVIQKFSDSLEPTVAEGCPLFPQQSFQ